MENQEIEKDDVHIGSYLYRTLNQKVSGLLRAERLKRGISYVDLERNLGQNRQRVRNLEHNKEKINWYLTGILLKYYHKRIVLTLEDTDASNRNLVFARMKDKPAGYHLDIIDE